jgi:hypothetical protein
MTASGETGGRRGASWAVQVAALVATDPTSAALTDKQARALARDPYLWSHPERIAQARTHKARPRGACSSDHDAAVPCDCPCDPDELAGIWAGVRRMATARLAAGQPLNDLDREALDHPSTPGADRP